MPSLERDQALRYTQDPPSAWRLEAHRLTLADQDFGPQALAKKNWRSQVIHSESRGRQPKTILEGGILEWERIQRTSYDSPDRERCQAQVASKTCPEHIPPKPI